MAWLRANGERCTAEQMVTIGSNLGIWLGRAESVRISTAVEGLLHLAVNPDEQNREQVGIRRRLRRDHNGQRRFLRAGGSLFIDDATPPGDDRFDACVRRDVARLFPDRPLAEVSNDHTVFRTFFLLQRPFGRVQRADQLEGVDFDDRSPVLYGRNDLFGAFGRDSLGNWRMPVVPGGAGQREMAFRVGINLVMYATCLNYKRDQVHTTAILRRRRWRVEPPPRENR